MAGFKNPWATKKPEYSEEQKKRYEKMSKGVFGMGSNEDEEEKKKRDRLPKLRNRLFGN